MRFVSRPARLTLPLLLTVATLVSVLLPIIMLFVIVLPPATAAQHLEKLTNLRALVLSNTKVTDSELSISRG